MLLSKQLRNEVSVDSIIELHKNAANLIQLFDLLLRHRILCRMLAPGVASPNSLRCHVTPFERAPFLQSLNRIIRASWLIPALVGTQKGRKCYLIEPNEQN